MNALALSVDAVCARAGAAPLSLALQAGDRLALLGPNGSGKSSLLRCFAGLMIPRSGAIARVARVGYCPQDARASMLPWLTAEENVALPTRSAFDDARARAAVARALAVVGLSARLLARSPSQLSGGEQQLVALARALAFDAPLLLLDEPFSALDAETLDPLRLRLLDHLAAHAVACVLVTHDLCDALALALAPRWIALRAPPLPPAYDGPAPSGPVELARWRARGAP
jgi:ABC-type nitrate/sulfonate/bicarbonate transport system ATPase subunit